MVSTTLRFGQPSKSATVDSIVVNPPYVFVERIYRQLQKIKIKKVLIGFDCWGVLGGIDKPYTAA